MFIIKMASLKKVGNPSFPWHLGVMLRKNLKKKTSTETEYIKQMWRCGRVKTVRAERDRELNVCG